MLGPVNIQVILYGLSRFIYEYICIYKCIYACRSINEERLWLWRSAEKGIWGGKGRKGMETWLKYNLKNKQTKGLLWRPRNPCPINWLMRICSNKFLITSWHYLFTPLMFCRRGGGSLCRCHLYNNDKEQFISLAVCFKQPSLLSLWKQSDLDSESLHSLEQKQSTVHKNWVARAEQSA